MNLKESVNYELWKCQFYWFGVSFACAMTLYERLPSPNELQDIHMSYSIFAGMLSTASTGLLVHASNVSDPPDVCADFFEPMQYSGAISAGFYLGLTTKNIAEMLTRYL